MKSINERKLLAYTAAAGSALFVSGSAAQAAVVYTAGFTSTGTHDVDVNNDGTRELSIAPDGNRYYVKNLPQGTANTGYAATPIPNPVFANTPFQVSNLPFGTMVGPSLSYATANGNASTEDYTNNLAGNPGGGNFVADGTTVGYIGLSFPLGDSIRYGWIGVSLTDPSGGAGSYTVTGYAYEDTGAAIAAGNQGAVAIAGDYNRDGFVDAADYTVWADSFGQTGAGLPADGNNDTVIDAADYTIWADNFGQGTPPSGVTGAVPEPTAMAFAAPALALLARRRRV